ncbi:MAG: hypothetical protein LH679_13345 [Cyanobacteria bacterium CAN_BIN43]|jgi:hypothetical protein|nr:hypothetical protein [Cyanobacteria bacterium CAN_BIN43]
MSSSDEYKRQVMKDLAGGNKETLDNDANSLEQYQDFDDFAQRSSRDERHQLFKHSFNTDRVPSSQMEPELQKAIAQIQPNERDDVARDFFRHLKKRGLNERDLEKQLSLSTHNTKHMSADDVSKLAGFAYHNHPDVFHEVLADQPMLVKFISNPVVGAALGAIASRWMAGRK